MTRPHNKAGEGAVALTEPWYKDIQPTYVNRARNSSRTAVKKLLRGDHEGRVIDKGGYARIKMSCHPRRDKITGYVYEQVVAAEMCLGRPLETEEIVHHDDGDKTNSYWRNLFVFPNHRAHARYHWAVRRGMKPGRSGIKLFDGISCKRPSLPKGGPPWMQSLRGRILGEVTPPAPQVSS